MDRPLEGLLWRDLVVALSLALRCSEWVVTASLQVYHQRTLSLSHWESALSVLAGNVEKLKQGVAVSPWCSISPSAVADMQVLSVSDTDKEHKMQLSVKCITGLPAGLDVQFHASRKFLASLAARVGFHRRLRPYASPWQFVSLRLTGTVSNESWGTGIDDIRVKPSYLQYNRKVLDFRYRNKGYKCPLAYRHPCHHCGVGYDACPGGVLPPAEATQFPVEQESPA